MVHSKKSFVIAAVTALFALPAFAGDVVIGSLTANQYTHPSFQVLVQASSDDLLAHVQIIVERNGTSTVLVPDQIQKNLLDGQGHYVVWTISVFQSGVVQPGDIVTAVVTDAAGDSGTKAASCRDGYMKKKKTNISASCEAY